MTAIASRPARPAANQEVPPTLEDPTPQPLGLLDQFGLWTNLGVSLLGFTGALFVLDPLGDGHPLSFVACIVATIVGTVIGTLAVAATGAAGARTGAPAMVLLRGLLGGRVSYLPTVLNVLQCLGWGIFEIVTIATASHEVAAGHSATQWVPRWGWIVLAGVITTLMTIRPLGAIRVLRRYVTVLVVLVVIYLTVQLLRHPLPSLTHGSWSEFWIAVDTLIGAAVSFVPLAADYTRHARSPRVAFVGTFFGYATAQAACYVVGIIALVTVAKTPDDIYGAFIAVPVGAVCFAVLAARELDQSFANVYSTAVSVQNGFPKMDRRVLSIGIGALTTVLALSVHISDYENFLIFLGSIFAPLAAVIVVDFFVIRRGQWDLSVDSPFRWTSLVAWLLGFVTYQLINPGYLVWWAKLWGHIQSWLHFTPQNWMSASLFALGVSAIATLVLGPLNRRAAAAR
jgi:NCS1 family nucleobase:cation symporter-1